MLDRKHLKEGGDKCMRVLNVFDIQRYALHDGPGIRTVIFTKGCYLNCPWCHNPESKSFEPQLGYVYTKCVGCQECERVCPKNNHMFDENGMHHIRFDTCNLCMKCVENCYNNALKVFGETRSIDDLIEIVLRDRHFYENSGGGLTVSGGEPMYQFEGTLALMRKAKEYRLHTCLDTSGYGETEKYREILPFVDIFLFDYKLTNPELHKKYTGVDNDIILRNLDMICTAGGQVFLRCPIIPGINDTDDHLKTISNISNRYDAIRQVNIMPYHDMGRGKASQIGVTYELKQIKTVEKNEIKWVEEKLSSYGCTKLNEA